MDWQLLARYFAAKSTDFFTVYRWMDDLRFYVLFNSISVISWGWGFDNVKHWRGAPFTLEKFSSTAGVINFLWNPLNSPVTRDCPPTLVEGDYSNGFVRLSFRSSFLPSVSPSVVDTILSPHLLLQFSRDFDETFQLLFPSPEDDHIISRSCSTDFYQSYGPLANF